MIDLWDLKVGDRIETRDGAAAEVAGETQDGEWIKVRYMEVEDRPSLVGTEDLCHEEEITHVVNV